MARARWVNGNQVAYGSGSWYRYVLDVDTSGNTITVWWGVETPFSLSDTNNSGDTNFNGAAVPFTNVNFQHGSGGGVTWLRGESFGVAPGATVSFSGFVRNLADGSGGGGVSSAFASWTNPAPTSGPPNQMAPPTITNIGTTTHRVNFTAPGTNGAAITSYDVEWYTPGGSFVTAGTYPGSPVNAVGFAPNTPYHVRTRANSSVGSSPWSAFTPMRQAVAAPLAPATPTVARTNDTSHLVSWTLASQTQGPYASQQVLRQEQSSGVWGATVVLATVSGTATSYVDQTTTPNRAYRYSVRATNTSGTATSGTSAAAWTTPGPPGSATATKNVSGDIVVEWSPPATAANPANLVYRVMESQDAGGTWTLRTTTAAGALSWTHAAPSFATHLYSVSAVVDATGQVGDDLTGAAVNTNSVAVLTPPSAPSNLTNTPAGTANRAEPVTLTWTHNPIDSTAQTKYTLQHRLAGDTAWTTVTNTSTVSAYTLPANTYPTGSAFEWRVLTYGLHADPSAYSAIATVQISSVPGVSITSPAADEEVVSTSLTVSWTFNDPDGDPQGSWEATLLKDAVALETRSGADTSTSTTFNYRLDETAYSVQVRVRDSRGLWSTYDTRNFTVSYPLPPTPVINFSRWDWKRGTVELSLSLPAPSGSQVSATYLEVWRSIDDGPLVLLSERLPPLTASYLDFTPTVDGKNTYLIQAISDIPSASRSDTTTMFSVVTTPGPNDQRPAVWLSGGPGFTRIGRLASEVTVDAKRVRERVLQRYAGRPLPVAHTGEHIDETWSISGNLNLRWSPDADVPEAPEDWLGLGAQEGTFLLRAPALFGGHSIYAYVSVEGPTVAREAGGNVHKVSFTATHAEEPS